MLKLGINHVSNKDYHADTEFLSSSNYKTLLKDPELFYKEKILGEKEPRIESNSFTEGSLTHSLILEPHKVNEEYAFFNGLRKAGEDYERFTKTIGDKTLISRPQKIRCDSYREAFLKNKSATQLISGGDAEYTICTILNGIKTKTRCDYINSDKGYIVDVKTSSYPIDVDTFRMTCTTWDYQLSAALYLQVAEQHYNKKMDFYFIVIGKKELECEVYKASREFIEKGNLQIAKASKIYKQCIETGIWKSSEEKFTTSEEILEV